MKNSERRWDLVLLSSVVMMLSACGQQWQPEEAEPVGRAPEKTAPPLAVVVEPTHPLASPRMLAASEPTERVVAGTIPSAPEVAAPATGGVTDLAPEATVQDVTPELSAGEPAEAAQDLAKVPIQPGAPVLTATRPARIMAQYGGRLARTPTGAYEIVLATGSIRIYARDAQGAPQDIRGASGALTVLTRVGETIQAVLDAHEAEREGEPMFFAGELAAAPEELRGATFTLRLSNVSNQPGSGTVNLIWHTPK